jgi:hypothetical protein
VSALGHYLEEEGIASVAISLIRPQTENTRPPRALWVPFELGRPFGPPSDAAFQKRVLLAALRLLERDNGPVVIEDFPDDDPRARPDPAWLPPRSESAPNLPDGNAPEALAQHLEPEIASLREAHARWRAEHGYSTVGLSGFSPAECGGYIAAWLRGKASVSPRKGYSAPLLLRFAIDDLKAYYLESAAGTGGRPSSRQLGDWLWNATASGASFHALRAMYQGSDDDRLKLIAGNFIVPALRQRQPA